MTTALDRLRGFASAARRDSTIATAEADILDRLVRVAEGEEDDRLDGALEELAGNLRRALDAAVDRDDDADDLPSTLRTGVSVREACRRRMPLDGADAQALEGALSMTERERDEARAEVERLRAEVASLRERVDEPDEWAPPVGWLVRTEARDNIVYALWERDGYTVTHKTHSTTIYMCDTPGDIGPAVGTLRGAIEWCEAQMQSAPTAAAPDTDEPDDGWKPGPWWTKSAYRNDVVERSMLAEIGAVVDRAALVARGIHRYTAQVWFDGRLVGRQTFHQTRRAAMRWCEAQTELADVIASYNSAPTVGAPDAGPDAPACDVEGHGSTETTAGPCAVPTAPGAATTVAEQASGADRPFTIAQAQAVDVSVADVMRGPDTEGGS